MQLRKKKRQKGPSDANDYTFVEIIDPGVMYTHLIATSFRGNSFYLFFLNFALRPLIAHVIDAPPVHSQMSLFKQ